MLPTIALVFRILIVAWKKPDMFSIHIRFFRINICSLSNKFYLCAVKISIMKMLNTITGLESNTRLYKKYLLVRDILDELQKRKLSASIVQRINREIDNINSTSSSEKELFIQLSRTQSKLRKIIRNDLKLATKNYYRDMYIPIGLAIGIIINLLINQRTGSHVFVYILSLLVGIGGGWATGTFFDKKAKKEGKQIDIELR